MQSCHELLLWLIPQLDKFPRIRRFTLGEQLENDLLGVLAALVEAAYSRDKRPALRRANLGLQVVRHLWRLCYELQVIPIKRYEHGARLLEDLGRQVGGWLRAQKEGRG
ncbi:MAG: diversity-generating retroelement protein Avd [Pseudomonadota bacterium]